MIDDVLKDAARRMDKSVEATRHEFTTIRTGRASAALLERINVSAYGTKMPINQLATIGVPEPRLLTITPFDKGVMKDIEKAIMESDLGLTPNNDGQLIRLPIPQLTEERRKELVKQVRHLAEEGRVAARNVRRDAQHHLKEAEKNGETGLGRRPPRRGAAAEGDRRARGGDRRRAEGQRGRDHGGLRPPSLGTSAAGRISGVQKRRDYTLLVVTVVSVLWRVVVAAIVAGGLALLTSVSFWPAFLVCFGLLVACGMFLWTRAVLGYRDNFREQFDDGQPEDERDWPGGGGVREPLPSGGPRSPLKAAADPEQSTGPSAIP